MVDLAGFENPLANIQRRIRSPKRILNIAVDESRHGVSSWSLVLDSSNSKQSNLRTVAVVRELADPTRAGHQSGKEAGPLSIDLFK